MPLPLHELARTEAAVRIASHARASNLFFSHFEHHVDLEGPDAWQPDARPDLGAADRQPPVEEQPRLHLPRRA